MMPNKMNPILEKFLIKKRNKYNYDSQVIIRLSQLRN